MKITRKSFLRSLLGMAASGLSLRHTAWPAAKAETPALKDLGRTGLRVTALGLGASRTLEAALIRTAVERGITFIDTGRSYMNGKNEEMLGRALQGLRQRVVIQTKLKLPEGLAAGETGPHLETNLEQSLRALRTDRIDVLLLHGAETEAEIENEAVKEFFSRAKASGKIRACGFSSHRNHLSLLEKTLQTGFYDVLMLPFNPFGGFRHSVGGWSTSWDQDALIRAMERARAAGIGIVAMKTCSGGPYAPAAEDNPSMAAAVRWVTDKAYVASAAVAMGNFSELEEHLARPRS